MTETSDGGKTMPVIAYKAFDADMTCLGFKYEVGMTYERDGKISLCSAGFHACTVPFDCWGYYDTLTFARVVVDGVSPKTDEGDSKIVGAKITIEANLSLPEWVKAQAAAVIDLCKPAKGALTSKSKECAAATGYYGHAAATGKHAIAASLGPNSTALAGEDGWIVLAAYGEWNGKEYPLEMVRAAKVGGPEGIKPNVKYWLTTDGQFLESAPCPAQ